MVGKYLLASGWVACSTCREPLPPDEPPVEARAILEWWQGLVDSRRDGYRRAVDRTGIGKGDGGPFVTALVERLSELSTDTLDDRFGDGARRHIARLHELARFEIDDEQVRPETRRTFAANRLVRAWAPAEMVIAGRARHSGVARQSGCEAALPHPKCSLGRGRCLI